MFQTTGSVITLLKRTGSAWIDLDLSRLGAAVAFYALFAIVPLFVIVLAMAGLLFGAEAARDELHALLADLMGSKASAAIQPLVSAVRRPERGGWETVIATILLFIGATGLFAHMQHAFNTIWGVRRAPGHVLRNFIRDRLLSLALVVGIGSLLLGSLVLGAVLSPAGKYSAGSPHAAQGLRPLFEIGLSWVVITLLFAMIFKILPDVRIPWRNVWAGAILSSLLFNLGKFLLILYLHKGGVSTGYGAAGSMVLVLLWVYGSAQIVILGAKFTQLYSASRGSPIEPLRGALPMAR